MDFYKRIGMTSKGYNQSWQHNSVKLETLSKIASVLGVPVAYFFASDPAVSKTHEPDEHEYTIQLQEKLIRCMEQKEMLQERLSALESEQAAPSKTTNKGGGTERL